MKKIKLSDVKKALTRDELREVAGGCGFGCGMFWKRCADGKCYWDWYQGYPC
jgi:hypothetical protein